MRAKAFSLIEMTMVVLILAIAAAAVSLNLRHPLSKARLDEAVEMVANYDRLTRSFALQNDRAVSLMIDTAQGKIRRLGADGRQAGSDLELPSRITIRKVLLPGQEIYSGTAALSISSHGLGRSYALLLEQSGGGSKWIIFAGLTGRQLELDDEEQVKSSLALLE